MKREIIKLDPKDFKRCSNIYGKHSDDVLTKKNYKDLVNGNRISFIYVINHEFIGDGSLTIDSEFPDFTIENKRINLSIMSVKKNIEIKE